MQRAPLVFVVALPKSGTHLIGELMKALGYRVFGPTGPGGFGESLDDQMRQQLKESPQDIPPNTCIVVHHLLISELERQMVSFWSQTGQPAIIFNYRDPRDMFCSWVRFLMKDSYSKNFATTSVQVIHSDILHSLDDDDARLMHVLQDPTFPGWRELQNSIWLLRHPRVCRVRFEELVGAEGGGSATDQSQAIARIMKHVQVEGDPEDYTEKIYRRDTPVFSRGQIGAWRKEFNPVHIEAFNSKYGQLLDVYGYPRETT